MKESSAEEILKQLSGIVSEVVKEQVSLTADTHVIEHKILDSLDFMFYVFQVQDHFNVEIPDEDLEQFRLGKVGHLVAYLQERTGNRDDT